MSKPSDDFQGEAAKGKVGPLLREAREEAGVDLTKMSTDLRLNVQTLEALERSEYALLSGDPYIRALLGSVARYLHLDPQAVIGEYNREIGAAPAGAPVSPYKDRAQAYTSAHKQIFIVIVVALFIGLFILIGRLNHQDTSAPGPITTPPNSPAPIESLSTPLPDTTTESQALIPDSGLVANPELDSVRTGKPPVLAPALASSVDSTKMTKAVIKPIGDSVWIKVRRTGKEDFSAMLRLGKQIQVSNPDTITVFLAKPKTVEVTVGGNKLIPDRKRFKLVGKSLTTF